MYQAVVLGQADACVEDKPIMADSIKTGGLDLKVVEGMESEAAPYGMAIMNEANQDCWICSMPDWLTSRQMELMMRLLQLI